MSAIAKSMQFKNIIAHLSIIIVEFLCIMLLAILRVAVI